MIDYVVVWNGGPLLPPRSERTSGAWRHMLTDEEAHFADRMFTRWTREEVHTGRLCACGCGQEMTYSRNTRKKDRDAGRFKTGHNMKVGAMNPEQARIAARQRDRRYREKQRALRRGA